MKPIYEQLYADAVAHVIACGETLDLMSRCPLEGLSDLADRIYSLRETARALEDLVKDINKVQSRFENTISITYIAMGPAAPDKIETEHVTISLEPAIATGVPKKGTDPYVDLLRFINVPEEVINHGALTVDFPGWCSYHTAMQSRGEELPEHIASHLKTYDTIKVKIRKRKALKGYNVNESSIDDGGDVSSSVPF